MYDIKLVDHWSILSVKILSKESKEFSKGEYKMALRWIEIHQ